MDIDETFGLPDEKMWNVIRKKYNEDPNQVQKQLGEFRNWLKKEPHLPKDIDEHLIRNFIRYQECNLEKAKDAFERYLVSRATLKTLMPTRNVKQPYFRDMVYKHLAVSQNLTPEGYRVALGKIPTAMDNVDFEEFIHLLIVYVDLMLSLDTCAGYIVLYFLEDVDAEVADKINVQLLKEALNMIYNIEPARVVNLHLVNAPEVPKKLRNTLESFMKPESRKKVYVHKDPTTLKDYLPEDMIPQEYGGTSGSLDELGKTLRTLFDRNSKRIHEVVGIKSEELPNPKPTLYGLANLQGDANINPPFID